MTDHTDTTATGGQRLHDWMLRMQSLVESRLHARFVIGQHDCCLWACDVVQAVCGYDAAHGIRGTYNTEEQAQALIDDHGGLHVLAADRFGVQIEPSQATAGDVGLIDTERGPALVACAGGHWLGAGPFCLVTVPTDEVVVAWRAERLVD